MTPVTPDGRYLVVRGRLWRRANPALPADASVQLVADLMAARRAVRDAKGDLARTAAARAKVDAAKRGLGERGPVWWTDGVPDLNRHMAANTPYAAWFAALPDDVHQGGANVTTDGRTATGSSDGRVGPARQA